MRIRGQAPDCQRSRREALAAASARLAEAGCDTPRLDAEVLLANLLGIDRAALIADGAAPLGGEEAAAFAALVARREAREPVAYIVGRRGFRTIELEVDRRVLIPRPETELVVEAAFGLARGARVVDVGTGSGAIALALKAERPDLEVAGTDTSAAALEVAQANSARLGLDVAFVHGDLLAGLEEPIDAVVSNPPYVEDGFELAPEITEHEPAEALFAGPDGLAVIRRLVDLPAQRLIVEVGFGQAAAVAELMREHGFVVVAVRRDLAGVERVVDGRRAL